MGKNELFKINLNIKNININIKRFRKTNRLLIENPSTRKPGKKSPALHPESIVNPKQVISISQTFPIYVLHILHGQFFGFHFLIAALKALTEFKSLNSDGTNCHMNGARYLILTSPWKTLLIFGIEKSHGFCRL